eukprot:Phypoly_transcript_04311.p1 GENE.Phypoly_transcript_04311~~Phypoly_transcript_04311.p1  ORF type:complete len:653 (+),score=97.34 Phypoly_transcript_04311:170-2128(+)
MEEGNISVEQVQEVLDDIAFASRYKPEDSGKAIDNAELFLVALVSPDIIADPIAYKVLQHLAAFLKDGLLERNGRVFETVEDMFTISNLPEIPAQTKTTLQELASGLFSHACNALQGNNALIVLYIQYLLKAMTREGGNRWNAYSCCGPMLMTRLEAFQPHAALLLEVMLSFPETLTVIHELYQLAPVAFVENMDLLVRLYESNCNGQLSILDIVRDLAKVHPDLVATHLATLHRIAQGANNDDVEVVKEIEEECAKAIPAEEVVPAPEEEEVHAGDGEPKDFDELVDYLNATSAKCHDLPSLREFLRDNKYVLRYLEDVEKVIPLPYGIDYCIVASESSIKGSATRESSSNSLKASVGSGSKGSFKSSRDSMKASKDNLRNSKDMKNAAGKDVVRTSCGPLSACFGLDDYELADFITLRFKCGAGGPQCTTHSHPLTVRANMPPPWIRLACVLFARSPPAPPLDIRIRKWHTKGDSLDALLEIAQSVEMAAALKREGGGGRAVDGFEVLSFPFLTTDDLGDLIVDLRGDGLFNAFHYNAGTNIWACSSCSSSTALKAKLSGYLVKKGRRIGLDVKRYYMLDQHHFFYATTNQKKPKRLIPVTDILSVNQIPENCLEIALRNTKRTIVLRAPSEQQAQRWLIALQDALKEVP